MLKWLRASSSGYYEWRRRPQSATAARREKLKQLITAVFELSDETYGYRRIHAALLRSGHACSPELVRALVRELGLVPCQPRPWRHSLTDQDPAAGPIPDLLHRDFTASTPGEKMVGDITYIPTWEGWVFLATVIDCYTKAVIGWAMSDNYKTPLISAAIGMAVRNHNIKKGAIFHSDRGSNGGFQWSSQHPDRGVCDGKTCGLDDDGDGQAGDAVAGSAGGERASGGAAAVLAANR
jgi:putative transposase